MKPDVLISAGSISARLGPGFQLRDIRVEGHTALDAVYYSVRDSSWNTIPEVIEEEALSRTEEGFCYTVVSRHTARDIDIRTSASIKGTVGAVELSFTAEALRDQAINRVGLCVLHPLELAEHELLLRTDGGTSVSCFPRHIAPHQPFLRLRGMTESVAPDIGLQIKFEGGLFETEDHRNWTDAGWKTYSPPLDQPYPRTLVVGHMLRQRIVLTPQVGPSPQPHVVRPLRVTVADALSGRMPRIGFGASDVPAANGHALACVRSLSPSFLLVELAGRHANVSRFETALGEAAKLRVPLKVLLACDHDDLEEWERRFCAHASEILSVTVVDPDSHVSSPALIDEFRDALGGSPIRIGAGTRGYFAQLNRSNSRVGTADFLCFTLSPEVHHFDDERIFDTLRAHSAVVRDAARLRPGEPIEIGPITLRQRLNLEGLSEDYAPFSNRLAADPRTTQQFAAAWIVGAVAGLSDADSLAFFTANGPGGVVDDGSLTPAGRVFAILARFRGATLVECVISDPRLIGALAIQGAEGELVLLVANYRPTEVEVIVDYLGTIRMVQLDPYEVRTL